MCRSRICTRSDELARELELAATAQPVVVTGTYTGPLFGEIDVFDVVDDDFGETGGDTTFGTCSGGTTFGTCFGGL